MTNVYSKENTFESWSCPAMMTKCMTPIPTTINQPDKYIYLITLQHHPASYEKSLCDTQKS